jgi:hypothetical protein
MTLKEKQAKFVLMVADLILYANQLGYELTFGDAFRDARCPYGSKKSLHNLRLAIDLNLFIDGEYCRDTKSHEPLGLYWESIGGSWGGRFEDSNHYSYEHKGLR